MGKEIIKNIRESKPLLSYYMVAKNGGYEVYQMTSEDDVVLEIKKLGDADAWDQSIAVLEQALGQQFQ
jgi:hypothetical protein